MFGWIENYIRVRDKVLITTRLRDFKGDYPLDVYGMTDDQAVDLIAKTASRRGITGILTADNIADLVTIFEGSSVCDKDSAWRGCCNASLFLSPASHCA